MPNDLIPTVEQAAALLTPGNLTLVILNMSELARAFYDLGDARTADFFAALVVVLGAEQQRRREVEEAIRLELDGPDIGGIVG